MRMLSALFCSLLISGCATVFTGYQSTVVIHNLPDSVRVFTVEGVELSPTLHTVMKTVLRRVSPKQEAAYVDVIDSTRCTIQLRSNRDYVLLFKDGESVERYPVYAKLSGWWFALDLICGGVPIVVDAITGNWNYYDPIEFK